MSKARQMVQYDRALGLLFSIFMGGLGKTIWGGKVEEKKNRKEKKNREERLGGLDTKEMAWIL